MSKLHTIKVAGFKSIRSIEQPLAIDRLTVLIGPNGSGKSNLLEVFTFLRAIQQGQLQEYVIKEGGADKLLHFGSRVTDQLRFELSFEQGKSGYEITLVPDEDDRLVPTEETVIFRDKQKYPKPYRDSLIPRKLEAGISATTTKEKTVAGYVRKHLSGWRRYHFHDTGTHSPMKKTADIDDNHYLRADGSNLASFLYLLREKHPQSFERIEATINQMAPFFREFALEPQKLNSQTIKLAWRHQSTDKHFGASSLSDGTLRFMALATLFLQPDEFMPSVILIDEPELGLHPYAIAVLAALVKKASVQRQVIASTQSPRLVDHFDPEAVVVANRTEGATHYSRLKSSMLESWLEDYSLGTLWEKGWVDGLPNLE